MNKPIDPKDYVWKSLKYRKWIWRYKKCYTCGKELVNERVGYESHHHRHSGGKRPSDHLLTALCLECHNALHYNEPNFYTKWGITKDELDDHCIGNMMEYLETLNVNPRWVALIALKCAAEEAEG